MRMNEAKPDLKPANTPPPPDKPSLFAQLLSGANVRRLVLTIVGVAIGASCPLLPPNVQVVCKAVAKYVQDNPNQIVKDLKTDAP